MSWAGVRFASALLYSLLTSGAALAQSAPALPPSAQFPPAEQPPAPAAAATDKAPPAAAVVPGASYPNAAMAQAQPAPAEPPPSAAPTVQPLAPVLPPPPAGVCQDGQHSAYESDVDCGGVCVRCQVGEACARANDCTSGLCKAGRCRERQHVPGFPIPAGYQLEKSQSDRATTARNAGIGFFALSYGASYVSALSAPSDLSWLYVPLIGPWLLLDNAEELAPAQAVRLTKVLLVTDGALQIAGALLWLGGSLSRGHQLVRDDQQSARSQEPGLRVAPHISQTGCGVRVSTLF